MQGLKCQLSEGRKKFSCMQICNDERRTNSPRGIKKAWISMSLPMTHWRNREFSDFSDSLLQSPLSMHTCMQHARTHARSFSYTSPLTSSSSWSSSAADTGSLHKVSYRTRYTFPSSRNSTHVFSTTDEKRGVRIGDCTTPVQYCGIS